MNSVIANAIAKGAALIINSVLANSGSNSSEELIQSRISAIDTKLKELESIAGNTAARGHSRVSSGRESVAVGCLPCARAHFATVAGTIKEALRFARSEEGIAHPEVQSRLQTAEEDITNIERHDWTPEKILQSPREEQEIMRRMLPKLRELRQDIMEIDSVEDLERAAAKAGELSTELRLEVLRTRGVDAGRIVELAKKVERGEMSIEEAKLELNGR